MSDWGRFLECVPWFVEPGSPVVVGSPGPWTRGGVDGLPELSALLASATVTPVSVAGRSYELLAWGPSGERSGWLCHPPQDGPADVPDVLRRLWRVCGGIVEQFWGPSTWWTNQNEVLTVPATQLSFAQVLSECDWARDEGLAGLVEAVRDYVTVAIEANGNLTAAHRSTGRLVLLAQDHAFERVTPWPGSPERLLYSFDELPDLAAWIEVCARAWR